MQEQFEKLIRRIEGRVERLSDTCITEGMEDTPIIRELAHLNNQAAIYSYRNVLSWICEICEHEGIHLCSKCPEYIKEQSKK